MHLARALSLARLVAVTVAGGLTVPLRQTAAQGNPKVSSGQLASQDSAFFFPGCKHDEVYNPSDIVCSDTSSAARLFSGHDIKSASITFVLNDGTSITQQLGRGFDAVFFSKLALQKFAIPYYKQADVNKATMLEAFVSRLKAPARPRVAPKPPPKPETKEP